MDKYFKFTDINEVIPFTFDHLEVGGCSMVKDWSGNNGFIEMKPFTLNMSWETFRNIDHDKFIGMLKEKINDGGYGCEKIIGAHVWIKAVYVDDRSTSAKRYIDNLYVGVDRNLTASDINEFENYIEEECC